VGFPFRPFCGLVVETTCYESAAVQQIYNEPKRQWNLGFADSDKNDKTDGQVRVRPSRSLASHQLDEVVSDKLQHGSDRGAECSEILFHNSTSDGLAERC